MQCLHKLFCLLLSIKHDNINFDEDAEKKKFDQLFEEFELADEDWNNLNIKLKLHLPVPNSNTNLLCTPKRVSFIMLFVVYLGKIDIVQNV